MMMMMMMVMMLLLRCSISQEWFAGQSYPVHFSVNVSVSTQHVSQWILRLPNRLSARRHFLLYVHHYFSQSIDQSVKQACQALLKA